MALWLFVSPACWASGPLDAVPAELPDAPQPQPQAAPQPEAQALEISILDGDGALNNIRQRTAREPIVQVKDRNRKPVAGVFILFAINDGPSGAGATIGGASTFSVVTDAEGRAQIHGYTPNSTEGKFTITVTATVGALVATAIIHQENRLGGAGENSQQSTSSGGTAAGEGVAVGKSARTGFHIIPRKPIARELAVVGVMAGVVVLVVVLTNTNTGSQITAGAGSVGHP